MTSASSPVSKRPARGFAAAGTRETERRLARLDRLAGALDSRFSVFGIRFGWDSILGLVPGIGDAATTLAGAAIIAEAARLGARRRVLGRMALNSGLDFMIGGIPLLGDAFDVVFKANRRNVALLRREMMRAGRARNHTKTGGRHMAERHRSKNKSRDTEKIPAAEGEISQGGRAGGRLPRDIGTRDEKKRATERPAGATRVEKADEKPKEDRDEEDDGNG
jgi:hypothetical protein